MRKTNTGLPADQIRLVRPSSITLVKRVMFCLLLMIGQSIGNGLTTANAQSDSGQQAHLYFFTSDGCAPCEVVKPSIAKLAAAGYPTTTINAREQPKWTQHFQISRTPTVVLVQGQRAVGRREGMISHDELLGWFKAINYRPQSPSPVARSQSPVAKSPSASSFAARVQPAKQPSKQPVGTKELANYGANTALTDSPFHSPTMHQGTTRPANAAESRAMAATVKLQVEDPEGISYATGTVIHTHNNESLVMTCGHVFRDSEGTGIIQAHYGFDQPTPKVGSGELIFYDAEARDIALVVIKTEGRPLPAVEVASRKAKVAKGDKAFSIGCDHGENPTIRRTQIKNRASYDGAIKYDIYGRPVDGRSGGGLFTSNGQIIGVCNAAVIDVDEGIYTALDTIHWQLAKVKLDHLFEPATALAMASPSPLKSSSNGFSTTLDAPKPPSQFQPNRPNAPRPEKLPSEQLQLPPRQPESSDLASGPKFPPARDRSTDRGNSTLVSLGSASSNASKGNLVDYEREVLIIVRSKDDLKPAKTITIDNPSHQLVDYLEKLSPQERTERAFDLARFREQAQTGVRRPFQSSVRR